MGAALKEGAALPLQCLHVERALPERALTCRPSQMRRRFSALLNATPSGRTQINSSRVHVRMVLAATPAETTSDTNAASASAEGWLCRWIGAAGPFAGSQSMRNPP